MQKPITLTDFILKEEVRYTASTGQFTLLLNYIQETGKIIASHIKKAGLTDILGKSGGINKSGDEVQKLDEFANNLFINTLLESGLVHALASEELEKPIYSKKGGKYVVFFDPLDGSSNIDINVSVGTIFSIYHKDKNILQKGEQQVAAGYIAYGSSVIFVYTAGEGTHMFTLDPSMGNFLLSNKDVRIPETGSIYSINEAYTKLYHEGVSKYLNSLKDSSKKYKLRYIGSMVADVHRTLLKGGIFIYPADKKHPNGKLRLMYEINPMSMLVQQAGGLSLSQGKNPMSITPTEIHQRIPIALGSKQEVKNYSQFET